MMRKEASTRFVKSMLPLHVHGSVWRGNKRKGRMKVVNCNICRVNMKISKRIAKFVIQDAKGYVFTRGGGGYQ